MANHATTHTETSVKGCVFAEFVCLGRHEQKSHDLCNACYHTHPLILKNRIVGIQETAELMKQLEIIRGRCMSAESSHYPCVARFRQNLEQDWVKKIVEAKMKQYSEASEEASRKISVLRCGSNPRPNALCWRCRVAIHKSDSRWTEETFDEKGVLRSE
ncbi:hypothetical protein BKA63DRAFT_310938 [Paraphoma chrysanthemicola]|nr:hypothetical protein BKA63DRAFT_310938 [Paraphoma chrysanthemicola]